MFSYDSYGWYSAAEIPGRQTPIEPPQPQGELRANWTGVEWVLAAYSPPPPPPDTAIPDRIEEIQRQLNRIDKDLAKDRTMREMILNDPDTMTYVNKKRAKAASLRAELKGIQ